MSQFWDTVEQVLEQKGVGAQAVLESETLLAEVVAEVLEEMPHPCSIWSSEAGAIHPVNDGELFVLLDNGHYDTGSTTLDITTFDAEFRVKEVLDNMSRGFGED